MKSDGVHSESGRFFWQYLDFAGNWTTAYISCISWSFRASPILIWLDIGLRNVMVADNNTVGVQKRDFTINIYLLCGNPTHPDETPRGELPASMVKALFPSLSLEIVEMDTFP